VRPTITRLTFVVVLLFFAATLAAEAQRKAMPVIGYLHFASPSTSPTHAAAFREGLSETGYVEGHNVAIEYRWAEGLYERLPALARDLVDRQVDVIAAFGPKAAHAAKRATATIPIVFLVGTDPVAGGLVASLAQPGGNLTGRGLLAVELVPKRLELLTELVPQAQVVALLVNPDNPYTEPMIRDVQAAARAQRVQLPILQAATERELDAAFATLATLQADALVTGDDPFFVTRREQIVALAARPPVPAIYQFREFPAAGGLISYGPSLTEGFRRAASYVARILKVAKPGDLPVERPTTFELVINLKTAEALRLTIPPTFLFQADEVIRQAGRLRHHTCAADQSPHALRSSWTSR
jgi:putative ABC transport system substrate-binding protein